jgi:hypothetical protein
MFSVKFNRARKIVAAGGVQNVIELWQLDGVSHVASLGTVPLVGGTNRLAFSADGSFLAAGSDARFISMWSIPDLEKIFQLDVLVGVRSVYGFDPIHGALAFDGENGAVRVLQRSMVPPQHGLEAQIFGGEVFFDRRSIKLQPKPMLQSPTPDCVPAGDSRSRTQQ